MSALDVQFPAWLSDAVCASIDPALWFPESGESPAAAKSICAACPVRRRCLSWALDIEAREGRMAGVYGGTTERERRDLRRAAA